MAKHIGKISFFIGSDNNTQIELDDKNSATRVLNVSLTNEEFVRLMSREGRVSCMFELSGSLDVVGKNLETKDHEFEIPPNYTKDSLYDLALQTCPEGWEPDNYFGSQRTFFYRDGKSYARTIIRRYV